MSTLTHYTTYIGILLTTIFVCKALAYKPPPRYGWVIGFKTGTVSQYLKTNELYAKLSPDRKVYYKRIFGQTTPSSNFVPVSNLNDFLAPFSKCFIHLTNFQNVDILQPQHPMVIRHQISAHLKLNGQPNKFIQWIPHGLNVTGLNIDSRYCPLSKLMVTRHGICASLNPTLMQLIQVWDRVDTVPVGKTNTDDSVAVQTSVYHALILDGKFESNWERIMRITGSNSFIICVAWIRVPRFCKVILKEHYSADEKILEESKTKPCKNEPPVYDVNLNSWLGGELDVVDEEWQLQHRLPSPWSMKHKVDNAVFVKMNFMNHFSLCENYIQHKNYWANLPFDSVHEKTVHALTHVFLSIMGNATYRVSLTSSSRVCTNGKWIEETYPEIDPFASKIWITNDYGIEDNSFITSIPDKINSLRFVSCGRARVTSLAFVELIKIFDLWIWLYLLLLMMIIPPIAQFRMMKYLSVVSIYKLYTTHFVLFIEGLCSIAKVLLEQGDNNLSAGRKWSRIIGGTFITAALVLSNAYKGQNVFNLVTNLRPIPYENFSQLVQGNFSIYSGSSEPKIPIQILLSANLSRHEISERSVSPDDSWLKTIFPFAFAWADPYKLYYLATTREKKYARKLSKQNWELLSLVKNHSTLLPTTMESLRKVCNDLFPQNLNILEKKQRISFFTDYEARTEAVIKSFSKFQNSETLEIMKPCNRTAVLVEDDWAQQLAFALSKFLSKTKDIYVGKEVLYEHLFMFKLHDYVRLSDMKRAKSVIASGIWEFWMKFFRQKVLFRGDEDAYELKRPKMSGNISVVFLLILVGWSLSSFVFILEVIECIAKLVLSCINVLKRNCLRVFRRYNIRTLRGCTVYADNTL
ncbi:unnamed protein product [Orchesella dallaii]|uniref:Uncharacterized protein n=1 Tax=Orchesella dallaii TaxID=48710 RepID=A0ABP1RLC9_9HEXA